LFSFFPAFTRLSLVIEEKKCDKRERRDSALKVLETKYLEILKGNVRVAN
jgi:hypothetical protein